MAVATARFHKDGSTDGHSNSNNGNNSNHNRRSSNNNHGDTVVEVDEMLAYLEAHKSSLTEISCQQVLDDTALERLWRFLRTNGRTLHLQTLRMNRNILLTAPSASTLVAVIQTQSATLLELDLSDNPTVLLAAGGLSQLVELLVCDSINDSGSSSNNGRNVSEGLPLLRSLDLSRNDMGHSKKTGCAVTLGRLLQHNRSLMKLSLAHNSLGPRSMAALAEGLSHNTTLQSLDLSYNKLADRGTGRLVAALHNHNHNNNHSEEEEEDFSSSGRRGNGGGRNNGDRSHSSALRELDLSFNKIGPAGAEHLATLLTDHNRTLIRLNLSLNVIGVKGAEVFRWVVRYNHTLEDLNLSRNNIGDGVVAIAQGLRESEDTRLRRLDLGWNSVTDIGATQLAEVLRQNSVLETLILASNAIGDEGIRALVHGLHSDLALKELDIVGNQMRDASALVQFICHGPYTLHRLAYEKNNLSVEHEAKMVHAYQFLSNKRTWMTKLLRDMTTKKMLSLTLQARDYGDEEIVVLARHLAQHRTLKVPTAFFHGSRVTDRGIMALARDVLNNTHAAAHIQRLYCQGLTKLTDRGINAIAQSLAAADSPLLCLTLSACNIGPEGAKLLAHAMEQNMALKRLNLEANPLLTDIGAQSILAAVLDPPHPSLISLNLSRNNLSDNALRLLGPLVKLENLFLEDNVITDSGALDIAKAVMGSESLRCLYLRNNRISSKGIQALKLFLHDESILEC